MGKMTGRKTMWVLMVLALLGTLQAQNANQKATDAIKKAEKAMGSVKSIRYSGTGKWGVVGMNWNPTAPWHSTDLTKYTRTIDYVSASSREEIVRQQENPINLGGEAPFSIVVHEGRNVSGKYAWDQPPYANGPPIPAPDASRPAPSASNERQLQVWLTPHGFLKAAAEHQATAETEMQGGQKNTVLKFAIGENKIVGTINGQNLVTRVETWLPSPVLGDMPVETTFSDYRDFGGVKFPMHIVQKQGGFDVLNLMVSSVEPNVANAALKAPEMAINAKVAPPQVGVDKLADGFWLLRAGHNSALIEFKDFVAVVEAPNNEARSLAVIATVKKLVPNKPIKYLINTHHHFDHSGGIRTYVAEGATVITHEANRPFYEWAWKQPRTLEPDRLSQNPREASFITYKTKYVLTDGNRSVEIHLTIGDNHDQFLSFVYMPKEKILIEADDWSDWYATTVSLPMWNNLYGNMQRLQLDVDTMVPLHGKAATLAEWLKVLRDNTL
jgi:hypothetical protein